MNLLRRPMSAAAVDVFAAWDLARLEVFPHGRRDFWRREGVTAVWFEPVEFFRRTWGWKRGKEGLWNEVEGFYRERGGSFRVDLTEAEVTEADGLGHRLRIQSPSLEHGYVNDIVVRELGGDPGACGGGDGSGHGEGPGVAGLEVRDARGADMGAFADIYLECFGARPREPRLARQNLMALERVPGWTPWLVWAGREAVGAYSLFVRDREGFLSSGSTLPAYAGLGIQRWMIRYRVAVAERLGLERATSYALRGSGSLRNLEREGFRVVDAKSTLRHPGQ